jgi:Protein of unknown function (DUF1573)
MLRMRKILTGCLVAVLAAVLAPACHLEHPETSAVAMADTARYTNIQWLDSASRNYGTITEGQKLDVSFRFRNSGSTPLVIGQVRPSCGCTIAEQPKAPIAPGAEGQIRAVFNSQGRSGVNHKTLFVTANTRGTQNYSLQFVVEVEKKSS